MTPVPPFWDPDRDEHLVCTGIRAETHDVTTFVFAAAGAPRLFRFLPGQFMTLDLEAAGVQRSYTIASPPTRPWRIEITAKRAPGGPGSGWLHGSVRPGARVRAMGPMGVFTLPDAALAQGSGRYLFLSAGSGITPVMSMARTLHDLGGDADVVFLHSARTPADLVFADELAAMARRPGFASVALVGRVPPGTHWPGYRGRLTPALLALAVPDLRQRQVFCCGPEPYMAAVRAMLDAAGFDRAHYHEESFAFAAPDAPAAAEPVVAAEAFTVRFARAGRDVPCGAGTTILAAARTAGLRLPSACGRGVCGTCKSRIVSGTVSLAHGGGIRQREIDAGLTLLCCARPTGDVVVDR